MIRGCPITGHHLIVNNLEGDKGRERRRGHEERNRLKVDQKRSEKTRSKVLLATP